MWGSGSSRIRPSCRPSMPRSSSPTIKAATSSRTCRMRTTRSGCAAMGWWTRRRCAPSPASSSISWRCRRPTSARQRQYYPAIYWYAMMKIPPEKDFGGSTDIPKNITRQTWRQRMGNVDCIGCHQLGQESTRTIPAQFGEFKTGAEAWMRRVGSGQFMVNRLAGQLGGVPFQYFGEWTDRVAKGELPKSKPPRPQGVERNVVVTSWEWGTEKTFIHDLISSDRRYPTVNAYGPLYSSNGTQATICRSS